MRIAILTEGRSEFKVLPILYRQIHQQTPHRLLSPLKVDVSPDAPPGAIARACASRLQIASADNAESAILLLDRERQNECPGKIASAIEQSLKKAGGIACAVVLKDRTFENWLIADLEAIAAQGSRYNLTNALRRKVEPNKADKCEGEAFLKSAAKDSQYDKVPDSEKICRRLNVERAARNSRSLRHFLHKVKFGPYVEQCRNP